MKCAKRTKRHRRKIENSDYQIHNRYSLLNCLTEKFDRLLNTIWTSAPFCISYRRPSQIYTFQAVFKIFLSTDFAPGNLLTNIKHFARKVIIFTLNRMQHLHSMLANLTRKHFQSSLDAAFAICERTLIPYVFNYVFLDDSSKVREND